MQVWVLHVELRSWETYMAAFSSREKAEAYVRQFAEGVCGVQACDLIDDLDDLIGHLGDVHEHRLYLAPVVIDEPEGVLG